MEKKFEVGQVWRMRNGDTAAVKELYSSNECTYFVKSSVTTHTKDGLMFEGQENEHDLVELVTNADGTPATAEAAALQLDPRMYDPTRTEFIDKLTHDVFLKYVGDGFAGDVARATDYVRAAVKLRDELVRGDAE